MANSSNKARNMSQTHLPLECKEEKKKKVCETASSG